MNVKDSGTLVLYHAGCWDGFAAAWAAYRYGLSPDRVDFQAVKYGDPVPDVSGRQEVFVLDFAFLDGGSAEPMRQMARDMLHNGGRLVWLDHHQTAIDAWGDDGDDYMGQVTRLDADRSGAGLAWRYFHADNDPRPWLIDYVEDRDLWRHQLPRSREVNAYLRTLPFNFDAFDAASHLTAEQAAEQGATALRVVEQFVASQVKLAHKLPLSAFGLDGATGDVVVVNTPYWSCSEVVGALAADHELAVGWFRRGDGVVALMIRSTNDATGAITARELAQTLGGGGHEHAAGAQLVGERATGLLSALGA